jgi:hypothetical protein
MARRPSLAVLALVRVPRVKRADTTEYEYRPFGTEYEYAYDERALQAVVL